MRHIILAVLSIFLLVLSFPRQAGGVESRPEGERAPVLARNLVLAGMDGSRLAVEHAWTAEAFTLFLSDFFRRPEWEGYLRVWPASLVEAALTPDGVKPPGDAARVLTEKLENIDIIAAGSLSYFDQERRILQCDMSIHRLRWGIPDGIRTISAKRPLKDLPFLLEDMEIALKAAFAEMGIEVPAPALPVGYSSFDTETCRLYIKGFLEMKKGKRDQALRLMRLAWKSGRIPQAGYALAEIVRSYPDAGPREREKLRRIADALCAELEDSGPSGFYFSALQRLASKENDKAEALLNAFLKSRQKEEPIWSYSAPGGPSGGIAVNGGAAYFGASDRSCSAIRLVDGKVLWKRATGDRIRSAPAVRDTIVYCASYDKMLHAFSTSTGEPLWSADLGGVPQGGPVLDEDLVFAASSDRKVYAFDAKLGDLVWTFEAPDGIVAGLACIDRTIVLQTEGKIVYALDCRTGAILWQKVFSSGFLSTPAAAAGHLVVASDLLYGLDLKSGAVLWKISMEGSPRVALTPDAERIVAACDDIYSIEGASGKILWKKDLPERAFTAPAVSFGVVYGVCETGGVYALDARTGADLGRLSVPPVWDCDPKIADGVLLSGGSDGSLTAVGTLGGGSMPGEVDALVLLASIAMKNQKLDAAAGFVSRALCMRGSSYDALMEGAALAEIRKDDKSLCEYLERASDLLTPPELAVWDWKSRLEALSGLIRRRFCEGITSSSVTSVGDGICFQAGGRFLVRLDGALEKSWATPSPGRVQVSPGLAGATLLVPYLQGGITAFDTERGAKIFDFMPFDWITVPPVLNDQAAVLGDWSGNLYSLDALKGSLLWSAKAGGRIEKPLILNQHHVIAAPIGAGVKAFKADSGDIFWSHRIEPQEWSFDMGMQQLYLIEASGTITAVNAATGAVSWSKDFAPGRFRVLVASNGRLHCCAGDGTVLTLKAVTGDSLWEKPITREGLKGAADHKGILIAWDGGGYTGADALTGVHFWRAEAPTPRLLLTYDGHAVLSDGPAGLAICDVKNGRRLWARELAGPPVWADYRQGMITVLDGKGVLYRWKLKGMGEGASKSFWRKV
jgi:outer membrane protein assembly factor BamB